MKERVDILNPSRADIQRYLDELRAAKYSPNTLARRLTAFRLFYDHLVEAGELEQSPVDDLHERRRRTSKSTVKPPQRLSASEQAQLLAAAAHIGSAAVAVIRLLLDGLTVTQLCGAQVGDLAICRSPVVLSSRTRGVPVAVTLNPETVQAIIACLDGRMVGSLLTDAAGRPIDRFDVARIVRRVGRRAGRRQPLTPAAVRG